MQIHEITLAKKQQVDEGILDAAKAAAGKVGGMVNKVGGMVQGAQQNRAQSKIDKKVALMADKAYKAWTTYKNQIAKYYANAGKPAPANAYSSALMNFVQKNLMPGTQIAQANNKADIIGLVKQISAAGQPKPTPAKQGAEQPPAQQGAQQPPAQQGAQQPPAQQGAAPGQAKPVVAQMPAGTPKQGAQQAAGAMKPNQARVQAGQLEKTIAAQNQAKVAPPAQPGQAPQAQPGQAPAQTLGPVPSTPAGANPAATVAPVPGQGPQANPPQKKKPVPPRTVQEVVAAPAVAPAKPATKPATAPPVDSAKEKQLFTQLVRAAALATPDVDFGDDELEATPDGSDQNGQPAQPGQTQPTQPPAAGGYAVKPGKRIKITKPPQAGQDQPSYYYKYSDGHWENELGEPLKAGDAVGLEKYIKADLGAKQETDPDYVPPDQNLSKRVGKKGSSKRRARGKE